MASTPPPPVFPPPVRKNPTWLIVLAVMACPLGCVMWGGSMLLNSQTAHSRPVGHGDITFDVSPDGRSIAFTGVGQGGRDLFLLDLESRRVAALTLSDSYEICPAFSPDGKRLAFTRGTPGVRADQLCIMDLTTHKVVQITDADENVSSPVFLPDGKRVLCTVETDYRWGGLASSWDEGGELRVIDLQTREQTSLRTPTMPVFRPRVSKDGDWIAWSSHGANIAPLAAPMKAKAIDSESYGIALNADGTRLAVSAGEYSPDHKIYVSDRAGKNRRAVSGSRKGCYDPVFSPDGKHVYFSSEEWRTGATGVPTKSLMRATIASGEVTEIAPFTVFENPLGR